MTNSSSSNHLLSITSLKHDYFALRHGQSLANVAKIISSDPKASTTQHGLSEIGKQQVEASAHSFCAQLQQEYDNNNNKQQTFVCIVSSDFLRAKETAQIYAQVLQTETTIQLLILFPRKNRTRSMHTREKDNGEEEEKEVAAINLDTRLRERFFGDWNGQSDVHYTDVWNQDILDSSHTCYNVESVNSVMERTTSLILELDPLVTKTMKDITSKSSRCHCILVAHGDVLQILQTAFLKCNGTEHRALPHLETASLRKLMLG